MTATKTILTAVLLTAMSVCGTPAALADDAAKLKVTDINVSVDDATLRVDIDIDPRAVNPGRDREVIFTPVILSDSGADSLALPQVRIAGKNRYYTHLRNHDLAAGDKLWYAGSAEPVEYRVAVPYQSWMQRCHIEMRSRVAHCCDPMQPSATAPLAAIDRTLPPVAPDIHLIELTGDEAIERTAEGSAYVDFIVNRTEIRPTYRRNKVELAKIIETIDLVKNDPDATITRVTIKGYASPEGPYQNNVRLAMGRTQALKEYVREHYNFDPAIMNTDYEPEDWDGLRRRMAGLDIAHKDGIMQIIDSPLEPDPRNAEIQRRYPEEYKFLLDSIYPALRHSDYTVKYRIRTYVDIEKLREVYATNPANLRPVDFERVAQSYPAGSAEREQVYLKAAEIHPGDAQANLNAANIALGHGDTAAAADYLRRAGDSPEAIYTHGALACARGDLYGAHRHFDRAASLGLDYAAAERDRVAAIIARPAVTYLITPTK